MKTEKLHISYLTMFEAEQFCFPIFNATHATSAATNSSQSNDQNATILYFASSNQSAHMEVSANSSAVTSTQQSQPSFWAANMSTSIKNNQNSPNKQQQQATIIL